MGTQLHLSSTYHPQLDRQTKSLNQCVEMYLRCITHQQPKQWEKWLSLAKWWYNTTFYFSIRMTPFEALYGTKPPQPSLGPYQQSNVALVEELLQQRYKLNQQLKENLSQPTAKMKFYADNKRTERSSEVGECVFLKLHPYKQQSVENRQNHKLGTKYFGPYLIVKKIGTVAYQLALLTASKIHPVFHGLLLKKKLGDRAMAVLQLPDEGQTKLPAHHPLSILESRTVTHRNGSPIQWLI